MAVLFSAVTLTADNAVKVKAEAVFVIVRIEFLIRFPKLCVYHAIFFEINTFVGFGRVIRIGCPIAVFVVKHTDIVAGFLRGLIALLAVCDGVALFIKYSGCQYKKFGIGIRVVIVINSFVSACAFLGGDRLGRPRDIFVYPFFRFFVAALGYVRE